MYLPEPIADFTGEKPYEVLNSLQVSNLSHDSATRLTPIFLRTRSPALASTST